MNPIERAFWTAKSLGRDNLPRRVLHALGLRSGWLRYQTAPSRYTPAKTSIPERFQTEAQAEQWHIARKRFFPLPDASDLNRVVDDATWAANVVAVCDKALEGNYPYFSHWSAPIGWPPTFNVDPVHNLEWPVGEHWTRTAMSGPPRDDIKLVWEPNRLTLAFHLARAYRRDQNPRWAVAFWELFGAWCHQNPVQLTVAWGCGQEVALRLIALLTGALSMLDSPVTTEDNLARLALLCWQSARRIRDNINYAISQENNHALSEAMGLWTVSLLFPHWPEASGWRRFSRRVLNRECHRQIYDDGSYIQHSLNYHRVMLDDLAWCIRLGEVNDTRLPDEVYDRFRRASYWLGEMIDETSGRTPNYGANDGANVLPLSCSDYLDYRPAHQVSHFISDGVRRHADGPWDEKLLWLCGRDALSRPVLKPTRTAYWCAPDGGYYILRGTNSWLATRGGKYRDRPHQADLLHIDLWRKGENILRDAGNFFYYHADPVWRHYFHSTAAHNAVEIDGLDQMTKGPRFLWFHWPQAKLVSSKVSETRRELVLEDLCYRRLPGPVAHIRTIRCIGDTYEIIDSLSSPETHVARIRWRLPNSLWTPANDGTPTWQSVIAGDALRICVSAEWDEAPLAGDAATSRPRLTAGIVFGLENPPAGWESLYYGEKAPTPTIVIEIPFARPVRVITTIHC